MCLRESSDGAKPFVSVTSDPTNSQAIVHTVHASVDDGQKLVVAARVAEELGVDGHGTALAAAARLAERVLDVEVAVASERNATARRAPCVVTPVPTDARTTKFAAKTQQQRVRVASLDPRLSTRRCPHSPLSAGACSYRSVYTAGAGTVQQTRQTGAMA